MFFGIRYDVVALWRRYMAKCILTGKRPNKAHNISHAHNVTRKWQKPNIQTKRVFVPELGRFVRLSLSTRAIRSITKVGLLAYARKKNLDLNIQS
jgi:large subunit ribosomal protein L28